LGAFLPLSLRSGGVVAEGGTAARSTPGTHPRLQADGRR
jgi:hypothetical protein